MVKVILIDADGVLIKKTKVFSLRFSEREKIPIETILPFFEGVFQKCLIGTKDLKWELPKYLKKWKIRESMEGILDFWFSGEASINQDVLNKIGILRKSGILCYLVTNNERYRVEYLRNTLNLDSKLDGIFGSYELGFKKPDARFFKEVMARVGKSDPEEIEFWDDDEENIDGAKSLGIKSLLWK